MVSPLIYLKSGDASATQARPISFSTSPKCPIGGTFTFAEAPKQEETQYQNQYVETQATDSTEFQAPTIAKTVSEKKYSTSYTAGIVSWICVGLGIVAIAVVMISTKVGARKRIR